MNSNEEEVVAELTPWSGTTIGDPNAESNVKASRVVAKGFRLWIAKWLVPNLDTMAEGGVGEVKGRGRLRNAEADAKIGEAARLHAEKERTLEEVNLTKANTEKAYAEADAARLHAQADLERAKGEAVLNRSKAAKELLETISIIRQKGGEVAFSEKQLLALLSGE